ncbi:DUF1232 domain-containing protein [Clostridium cadaveris]|uniref:YkvA family protein n=1 Tax=Clostridium cadaveris TaxID=1529 RepID=UPI001459D58F|nr:YkvA family protein [Clostridium cadaveris]NME65706.1 DUF1232 domain-containing protein [Clostridium cadaveris]
MRVSSVNVSLSGDDIISIINDFMQVPGLSIYEVNLKDFIEIKGEYKALFKIPFSVKLALGNVDDNKIHMTILKIGISKLSIWSVVRRQALKVAVKNLKEQGINIDIEKDVLTLDLDDILEKLPVKLELSLKTLTLKEEKIYVETNDIDFSLEKEVKEKEVIEEQKEEVSEVVIVKKVDGYSKFKENVENKVPEKYSGAAKYLMIVPDFLALLYRLFKDERVDKKTKAVVGVALGYLASPIDILPDSIPFIGKIDDVAIIFFVLNKIVNDIPENVLLENWQGQEDIMNLIKEGVNYINSVVGGDTINSIWTKIESMF